MKQVALEANAVPFGGTYSYGGAEVRGRAAKTFARIGAAGGPDARTAAARAWSMLVEAPSIHMLLSVTPSLRPAHRPDAAPARRAP